MNRSEVKDERRASGSRRSTSLGRDSEGRMQTCSRTHRNETSLQSRETWNRAGIFHHLRWPMLIPGIVFTRLGVCVCRVRTDCDNDLYCFGNIRRCFMFRESSRCGLICFLWICQHPGLPSIYHQENRKGRNTRNKFSDSRCLTAESHKKL